MGENQNFGLFRIDLCVRFFLLFWPIFYVHVVVVVADADV